MPAAAVQALRVPDPGVRRRHLADRIFEFVALGVLLLALAALAALLADIFSDGASRLNWQFMTNIASRRAADAGIYHALAGSIAVVALTAALALPVGVAAAV
jgi:phosphate transport system permease protein